MTYQQLCATLKEAGLPIDEKTVDSLSKYAILLKQWNEKMNLTSIVEEEEVIEKHFLDCLLPAAEYDFSNRQIADIGSGAGFPGMVLALVCPSCHVTLIDATKKKFAFLQEVKDALGLENVSFLQGRVEELNEYREKFDVVISRGFSALRVFAEVGAPLLRVTGTLIAMKGPNGDEELAEAKNIIYKLSLRLKKKCVESLPGGSTRINYYFAKDAKTPKAYPRRWDEIQRKKI